MLKKLFSIHTKSTAIVVVTDSILTIILRNLEQGELMVDISVIRPDEAKFEFEVENSRLIPQDELDCICVPLTSGDRALVNFEIVGEPQSINSLAIDMKDEMVEFEKQQ